MTREQYSEIFEIAVQHNVKRSDLAGSLPKCAKILKQRINERRLKWGYNTDWNGQLWEGENKIKWQNGGI